MDEQFTVYALVNEIDTLYVGYTQDIQKRLRRHNGELKSKKTSFTSKRRKGTWKLIYSEICVTRKEAASREKQLKSYRGRQFLKGLVK